MNKYVIEVIDNLLKQNNDISIQLIIDITNLTKEDILNCVYKNGGYCIAGALTDYGTISKL